MRYLVVIPPGNGNLDAVFSDIDSRSELTTGDTLLDELLVRVRLAVDVPADDSYDATLVCTPDE